MALSTFEAILFVIFLVIGLYLTIRIYRWIMSGITTRKVERSATRVGRYGKASEKKIVKGK